MPPIPGQPCTRCRRLNIQCTQQASSESSWPDNKNLNGSSSGLSRGNNLASSIGGAIACRLSKKRPSAADDTVGALLALREGTASAAAFNHLHLPGHLPGALANFPSGHPSAAASQHAMAMAGFGFPAAQATFLRSLGTNGVPTTPATPGQWSGNAPQAQQEQFMRHMQQNQQLLFQYMQQHQQQHFQHLQPAGQQIQHQQGEQAQAQAPPPPPQPGAMPAPGFLMPPPKFPVLPGFGFGHPFMPYGSLPNLQRPSGSNSGEEKSSPSSGEVPTGTVDDKSSSSNSHDDKHTSSSCSSIITTSNSTDSSSATSSNSNSARTSDSSSSSSSSGSSNTSQDIDSSSTSSSSSSGSVANRDTGSDSADFKRAKLDSDTAASVDVVNNTHDNATDVPYAITRAADGTTTKNERPEPEPELKKVAAAAL